MVEVQRHHLVLHLHLVLLRRRNNSNKMEVHQVLCLRDNIATICAAENARVKIVMKKMIPMVAPVHSALIPARGVVGDSSPTLKMITTRRRKEKNVLVKCRYFSFLQKLVIFNYATLKILLCPLPPPIRKQGKHKQTALVVFFFSFRLISDAQVKVDGSYLLYATLLVTKR